MSTYREEVEALGWKSIEQYEAVMITARVSAIIVSNVLRSITRYGSKNCYVIFDRNGWTKYRGNI